MSLLDTACSDPKRWSFEPGGRPGGPLPTAWSSTARHGQRMTAHRYSEKGRLNSSWNAVHAFHFQYGDTTLFNSSFHHSKAATAPETNNLRDRSLQYSVPLNENLLSGSNVLHLLLNCCFAATRCIPRRNFPRCIRVSLESSRRTRKKNQRRRANGAVQIDFRLDVMMKYLTKN